MNKKTRYAWTMLFIMLLTVLLLFTGCTDNADSVIAPSVQPETDEIVNSNVSDGTEIIEESTYYKITKNNGLYHYDIYDKNNNIVRSEGDLTKEPCILMVEDYLIRITTQAGTGIGTQSGYYYDVESNVFSQIYQSIFDQCDGLVACATHEKVIIRDIFDDDGYYLELAEFSNTFSQVAFPFVNVEFVDDGLCVCVEYFSGEDFEKVSEVFELK